MPNKHVQVVFSPEDYEELHEMAKQRRLPLSVMIREIVCKEIRK